MFYLLLAAVLLLAGWLTYEFVIAPIDEDDDSTYDPTTSVWHDDDYHPNH